MSEYQDYYQLLAVPRSATLDEIKSAYRRRMRQLHPDRFEAQRAQLKRSGKTTELRKLEQKIERAVYFTRQVNQAYAVLSDQTERSHYDASLARREHSEVMEDYGRAGGYDFYAQDAAYKPPPSPPKSDGGALNVLIFIGLIVVAIMGFSSLTSMFSPDPSPLVVISNTREPFATRTPTPTPEPTLSPRQWADDLRAAGDAHFANGEYDAAIISYTLGLEYIPNDVGLLLQRGLAIYERWLLDGDEADREAALADLQRYAMLVRSPRPDVRRIIQELEDV